MKIFSTKNLSLLFFIVLIGFQSCSQGLGGVLQKTQEVISGGSGSIGANEIAAGLKEALAIGAEKGSTLLSQKDAFFANAALKVLLPPEAQKIESTLRTIGMGKQVDEAVLSLNRAAEDACKSAAPIFVSAIKQMSVTDAIGILKGGETAATNYLQQKTTTPLTEAFRPVIENSLQKTGATKYWNTIITAYNKISIKKVNPDLAGYVTERAMSGVYQQIALEERNIRQNPIARTTDLLKRVFAK